MRGYSLLRLLPVEAQLVATSASMSWVIKSFERSEADNRPFFIAASLRWVQEPESEIVRNGASRKV